MSREEFLQSLDDLLEVPPGTLTGAEHLENLENWNSMAMIGFIALADKTGVRVSPPQIAASTTVADLLTLAKIA
jgi:acyl carrier protein